MSNAEIKIRGDGAWQRTSLDDGKTWSEPREISASIAPEIHNALAFGPGHGICTKDGTLIVPIWMVLKSENAPIEQHWPSVISTIYSKDNGKTWSIKRSVDFDRGGYSDIAVDESKGYIYILYEEKRVEDVCLARITPDWLIL